MGAGLEDLDLLQGYFDDLEVEFDQIKASWQQKYAIAQKTKDSNVRKILAKFNEYFFQGHFPEAPVMPGVLQIEAMAQVGAILALREFENREDKIPFFSGIEKARFRRPVVPGDTLVIEVIALRIGSKVQKMHGIAKVDGNITAEAEIMCIIGNRERGA